MHNFFMANNLPDINQQIGARKAKARELYVASKVKEIAKERGERYHRIDKIPERGRSYWDINSRIFSNRNFRIHTDHFGNFDDGSGKDEYIKLEFRKIGNSLLSVLNPFRLYKTVYEKKDEEILVFRYEDEWLPALDRLHQEVTRIGPPVDKVQMVQEKSPKSLMERFGLTSS